ncbi:AMP-binding protein [Amycolatopsis antarctica]|nr:AMP-binding protein [Amycolatopsis antarctica]
MHERAGRQLSDRGAGRSLAGIAELTLPGLLEIPLDRIADATAVVCGAEAVSHAELHSRANRLARSLITRGVGPDRLAAVALPRTVDAVVAVLAVLKAGGAYLPVDPGSSAAEFSRVLAEFRPVCVLATTDAAPALPVAASAETVLWLDDPAIAAERAAQDDAPVRDEDRSARLAPQHLAYVLGCPGTAERLEGVAVQQRGVVALARWAGRYFGTETLSSVLMSSSLHCDASVFELFPALAVGGRVELVDDLASVAARGGWSGGLVSGTPPVLAGLLAAGADIDARSVVLSCENLPAPVRDEVLRCVPDPEIASVYGRPEVTVYSLARRAHGPRGQDSAPPGGAPLLGTGAHVLDASLRPVPAGVPGELYISGAGLARGYLGDAALTSARFVANPFDDGGTRMYRTGDVVCRTESGDVEHVGTLAAPPVPERAAVPS